MIISYNKKDKKISPLDATTFAKHNIMERTDIEAWIENNPDILGEEFYIIATEYNGFDKTNERPDILAIDENGILTVIELKRDFSGKDVDLQAIKYAAYCSKFTFEQIAEINVKYLSKKGITKSIKKVCEEIKYFLSNDEFEELNGKPRIMLVARKYAPKVVETVLWLREFEIDISCIKLEPYIFDTDTIVLESSVIIPLPEVEDFIKPYRKILNETQEEHRTFYARIMKNIKSEMPSLRFKYHNGNSYCQIQTNIARSHFEWLFHRGSSSFGVEIHFEEIKKAENERIFNEVLKLKDELERETGETVIEDRNWGWRHNKFRIYIEKQQGDMNDDLIKWGVEKMKIFMNVINKALDKLETEDDA